jgi:Ca2+-binding EF-hand superfamily protein
MVDPVAVAIPDLDPKMADSFTQTFKRFDKNRNGRLDKEEFRAFMESLHQGDPNKYLFRIIDADRSGTVSLDEFLAWGQAVRDLAQAKDVRRWLKMVFDACDPAHTNVLNKKQFFKFMKYCGAPVAVLQRSKIFKTFDGNGNGTIEFAEIMDNVNFVIK